MTSTETEHHKTPGATAWIAGTVAVAGGVIPMVVYWLLFGQVATLTPQEARQLLQNQAAWAVLVDVRGTQTFAAGHVDGSVNWPIDEVLGTAGPGELPDDYRDRQLLLICEVGLDSTRAAWHLGRVGVTEAVNVRGGIQEWIHTAAGRKGEKFDRWRVGPDRVVEFPFRPAAPFAQIVAVVSFFLVKPVYTLLALGVIVVLWPSRDADLAALRWAMIFFFLGENACAVNYLGFKETSLVLEYLHSYGMLLCFGFTAYSVLEAVDRRILKLSDPAKRCAAFGLCGNCIKYADVPCGLKWMFYLLIPVMIVLALMLVTADWQDTTYNTVIFQQFYNYGHLRIYQIFEDWYCAAAAIVLFAASLSILTLKKNDPIGPAKVLFAAGLGPFGFGMLRMILAGAYGENRVWYLFWEETTEFLFILAAIATLMIFRRRLLPEWDALISRLQMGPDV